MNTLSLIATITKEVAVDLPPEDFPQLADAVFHVLDQKGMYSKKALFIRTLDNMFAKAGQDIPLTLTTPTGQAGHHGETVAAIIEKKQKKTARIQEVADPDVIGGALLVYKNERFDGTIRGALSSLSSHLLSPHPS